MMSDHRHDETITIIRQELMHLHVYRTLKRVKAQMEGSS